MYFPIWLGSSASAIHLLNGHECLMTSQTLLWEQKPFLQKKKRLKKVQGNTHQLDVYSSVLKVPTSKGSLKRINQSFKFSRILQKNSLKFKVLKDPPKGFTKVPSSQRFSKKIHQSSKFPRHSLLKRFTKLLCDQGSPPAF